MKVQQYEQTVNLSAVERFYLWKGMSDVESFELDCHCKHTQIYECLFFFDISLYNISYSMVRAWILTVLTVVTSADDQNRSLIYLLIDEGQILYNIRALKSLALFQKLKQLTAGDILDTQKPLLRVAFVTTHMVSGYQHFSVLQPCFSLSKGVFRTNMSVCYTK